TCGAAARGLRRLLEEQVAGLSPLERSLLTWLAVEREPVGVAALAADLGPGAGPGGAVLEALEGLGRRSLLERGAQGGTHTLQPAVLEYVSGDPRGPAVASSPRRLPNVDPAQPGRLPEGGTLLSVAAPARPRSATSSGAAATASASARHPQRR